MKKDDFTWLSILYNQQCNGKGIKLKTLDNPGWYFTIDLVSTDFENKIFEKLVVERSEHDWYHCFIREGEFIGACGPLNLHEVFQAFRKWIESCNFS